MLILFLLLVVVAIALGILGVVVKGLLYLLFTGIGVLLIAFLLGALWMRHRAARRRDTR
jgi:TM2 domain-containing membrane protein YozV